MDIRCPICGAPWDIDELHDTGRSYEAAYAMFRKDGCRTLGERHSKSVADPRIRVLMEVLGDDVDGAAAEMEDLE